MDETQSQRWMGFIPVCGMPTSVLKYGTIGEETKCIYLVIPGNPGIVEYYDEFMRRLFHRNDRKIPVWGVSHAGHVKPVGGNPALYKLLSYDVCTLEGQIRHKVSFINDHISKDVKLILIGHSIGCYFNLKVMDQLENRTQRCFQLFPTIERMAVSPNGLVYTPALKYFRWLGTSLAFALTFVPENIRKWLIKRHFSNEKDGHKAPECIHSATLSFLQPQAVSNSTFMANQEMAMVAELDEDLVRRHLPYSSYYYGRTDKWCPQEYYQDFVEKFPDADARLCSHGYSHAYVVDASVEMADIVYEWMKSHI